MANDNLLCNLQLRLKRIIDIGYPKRGAFSELSRQTGISAPAWNQLYHGRSKPTGEHLAHLCKLFPKYTLWLMTGTTATEAGQTSPDIEQLEELQKAVNQ